MAVVAYAIGTLEKGAVGGGGSITGTLGTVDSLEVPYTGSLPLLATVFPDKAAQFFKGN
ncbi:MAG: hypothetical protein M2R45_04875 [Verrucomicrobia subdivision 3 bacterium]|nr:hypothetical protein [Limisphaerales bacterium]MCS1417519.1 hypothetical protein [Limisphaerales bacterium]